jgi:hypothetical protein
LLKLYRQHESNGMLPTSGHFLYYELESLGYISKVTLERTDGKKGRRPDQNLIDALTELREAGKIPWNAIVDESRSLEDYTGTSKSIRDWTIDVLERREIDIWKGSAPLILCESRSLVGVLRPIVITYRALITSTNGQANGFLRTDVAPFAKHKVGYFGDLDLSGGHIEQNTRKVLGALDWERLAITDAQVRKYRLTRIQKYDKRTKSTHDAVETEALGQERITRILREWLERRLPEPLDGVLERERVVRERFRKQLRKLKG